MPNIYKKTVQLFVKNNGQCYKYFKFQHKKKIKSLQPHSIYHQSKKPTWIKDIKRTFYWLNVFRKIMVSMLRSFNKFQLYQLILRHHIFFTFFCSTQDPGFASDNLAYVPASHVRISWNIITHMKREQQPKKKN